MTSPVPSRATVALALVIAPLAAIAAGVGLLVPGIYRDPAWLVPQARGQDLVTLAGTAALVWAVHAARRGSTRAHLVWLGILGYVAYTYVGAAFAYAYNELFLLYVALFGLSVFALALALGRLDAPALASRFDERAPRRAVGGFLVLVAAMLCALWLGQIVPALVAGKVPDSIVRSGGSLKYVFALDLGLVVPLAALSAAWLWRRRPWGFVLAGVVLVKASTMGLALLAMTAFAVLDGQPAEVGLFVPWVALAAGSLALSWWFLAHCRSSPPGVAEQEVSS